MKVLHLVDPRSPGGGPCTLRLIADLRDRLPEIGQDVLVVGNATDVAVARGCGAAVIGSVCPPLNDPALARRGLKRALRRRESRHGRYDLLHAWTSGTTLLLALAAGRRRRLATLGDDALHGGRGAALRWALRRRPMPLLVTSVTLLLACRDAGLDPLGAQVLTAGVDGQTGSTAERTRLRREWGGDEAGGRVFCVGLFFDPAEAGDARRAVAAVARVRAAGRRLRIVVHPGARGRTRTRRWLAALGEQAVVVADARAAAPWRITAGLDAALWLGTGAERPGAGGGGWMPSLLWVMSAGVPVIADDTPAARDVIEPGDGSGVLVPIDAFDDVCAGLLRVCDDRAWAEGLGERARAVVRERFPLHRVSDQLAEHYSAFAGLTCSGAP